MRRGRMRERASREGRRLRGALALAALLACAPAAATNGYFAHGYSAAQRALGGAGTALTEDALVATINPAGAAWVGERLDINLSLFAPARGYLAGPVGSGAQNSILRIGEDAPASWNPRYYIPGFAYVAPIDEVSSWGIAVYGNGGLNTEYHGNIAHFAEGFAVGAGPVNLVNLQTQCAGSYGGGQPVNGASDSGGFCGKGNPVAQVDLIQLFIAPHYARKFGATSSIGIAPIVAGQRFRADGLKAFAQFSNAPDKVSDNRYDLSYGYGGRVGVLTGAIPGFGFGASYQTRIRMSPFKKYQGLFAGGGDFDVPSSWNLGLSAHPTAGLSLAYDFQRINFSEIKSVGNRFDPNDFVNNCARPRLLAALGFGGSTDPSDSCLGAATGPGFGWRDVSVHKFGIQYRLSAVTLRAGYSQTHQPIPQSEVLFNILAPAVIEKHYTVGASYALNPSWGLDFTGMYAPGHPVVGKNPLSNTSASAADLVLGAPSNQTAFGEDANDQDIQLDMHQYEITVGLSYRFQ